MQYTKGDGLNILYIMSNFNERLKEAIKKSKSLTMSSLLVKDKPVKKENQPINKGTDKNSKNSTKEL